MNMYRQFGDGLRLTTSANGRTCRKESLLDSGTSGSRTSWQMTIGITRRCILVSRFFSWKGSSSTSRNACFTTGTSLIGRDGGKWFGRTSIRYIHFFTKTLTSIQISSFKDSKQVPRCHMHKVFWRIVQNGIAKHQTHIVSHLFTRRICQCMQLGLYGPQVHWSFDNLIVIGKIESHGIDWSIEDSATIVLSMSHEFEQNTLHGCQFGFQAERRNMSLTQSLVV
mmetsp:Transcript_27237/g.49240  ORF Transcript_27237/g.49240 Transcript_27237/m.49240 type:complete len:224 (+) Transcript_27237:3032-3703(+)